MAITRFSSADSPGISITGGAGFVRSCMVQLHFKKYPAGSIFKQDEETYPGNPEDLCQVVIENFAAKSQFICCVKDRNGVTKTNMTDGSD